MDSRQFAAAYHRDIPEAIHPRDAVLEFMTPPREWSYRFGQALHDYLVEGEVPPDQTSLIQDYGSWALRNLQATLLRSTEDTSAEGLQASNEINFHRLNACMLALWHPIITGQELTPFERSLLFWNAQDTLALHGLETYMNREVISKATTDYIYFEDSNKDVRATFEGNLNELDAALVLIEIARRRPDLTVVPAPMQFERHYHQNNADFVVVSTEGRAIGVQVKSHVGTKTFGEYDSERVVLLDGSVDVGNVLARRTKPGTSQVRQVGWAGLVCAQHVRSIPAHGPRTELLRRQGANLKAITRNKMLAMQVLRGIKPNFDVAVAHVGERVLAKL